MSVYNEMIIINAEYTMRGGVNQNQVLKFEVQVIFSEEKMRKIAFCA